MYQIETQDAYGNWTTDGIGDENTPFDTREEAEAMIEQLRLLGEDWTTGEYRVVEVA